MVTVPFKAISRLLALLGLAASALATAQEVYLNDAGGTVAEIRREVFYNDFTKQTGVKVIASSPTDNAKLKAMVTTGNTLWDIVNNDGAAFHRNIREGLLQKLDLSKFPKDNLVPQSINEYGLWNVPYATVLVWNTKLWPLSGKHPTSILDLWNQKDFPGPRCLQKGAVDNLEWAVLSAGVAPEKRYPIDEKKAYAELDKLKPNVAVWWTTGAQSMQVIINGDCVMGTAWNGRPYQLMQKESAPLGVAWKNGILHESWWTIPKGAKNVDAAYKLLNFMLDPKRQGALGDKSQYAGGVKDATNFMTPETRQGLATSTEHLKEIMIADDGGWWVDNGPAAEKRFQEWLLR